MWRVSVVLMVLLTGGLVAAPTGFRTVTVTGTIVDSEGQGVPGLKVAAVWHWEDGKPLPENPVKTNKDGGFKLKLPLQKFTQVSLLSYNKTATLGCRIEVDLASPETPGRGVLGPLVTVKAGLVRGHPKLDHPSLWVYSNTGSLMLYTRDGDGHYTYRLPPGSYKFRAYVRNGYEWVENRELKHELYDGGCDLGEHVIRACRAVQLIGQPLPGIDVISSKGFEEGFTFDSLKGQWGLVLCWSHWSTPTVLRELPRLKKLEKALRKHRKSFTILGIHDHYARDGDDLEAKIRAAPALKQLWKKPFPYPTIFDADNTILVGQLELISLPNYILIAPDGTVHGAGLGSPDDLIRELTRLKSED